MRHGAFTQRFEVIAALQHRDDSPLRMPRERATSSPASSTRSRLLTSPSPPNRSSRCASKPAEIRMKLRPAGSAPMPEPFFLSDLPGRRAIASSRQRDVDHVGGLAASLRYRDKTGAGEGPPSTPAPASADRQIHLPCRYRGGRRSRQSPHARGPLLQRDGSGDCYVVEDTEPHGPSPSGMVPAGPHGAECVLSRSRQDLLHSQYAGAGGSPRRGGGCRGPSGCRDRVVHILRWGLARKSSRHTLDMHDRFRSSRLSQGRG